MRESAHDRAPRHAFRPAPRTPAIRLRDPTLDHRPVRLDPLPDSDKPELVETAERSQVRGREGSVGHVEVFRLGSVRTSILEDLDPSPRPRRATRSYTLVYEEPLNHSTAGNIMYTCPACTYNNYSGRFLPQSDDQAGMNSLY